MQIVYPDPYSLSNKTEQRHINPSMKQFRLPLITLIFLLLAVALSACSGSAFASTSWPGIIADENAAYLAYNQHVYAINLDTGIEKWRYPQEADNKISFYAPPALTTDGQLIVGGYNNLLYSLDPANGSLNWTFDQAKNRFIGSPLVRETGIFAPSADGNLYALDLNGNLLWPPYKIQKPLWAQPAADEDCECIYLTSMDHHVYAINAENGTLVWKSEDLRGAIVGTPAYDANSTLYVGTFSNEMLAFDAKTGRVKWRFPTDGWVWSGPALAEEMLLFGDLNGNFYALDATNGAELWRLQPNGPIVSTPLVVGDTIYFTTEENTIYAVDKDGNPVWNQTVSGKIYASPVLAGDLILVAPIESDTLLVALMGSGAQKWNFTPEQK